MKMRTISKVVLLGSILLLGACGDKGDTKKKNEAKTQDATVKVEQGNYVLQDGENVSEDEGYLALDIAIKNNTKDTLDVSSSDFSLYDSDDNKIANESIYTDDDDFKMLSSTNLSGSKKVSGYIVFKVDKDKKYELHYKPVLSEDGKKAEEVKINVNAAKYKDPSEDLKKLADQYVSQVFLGKDAEDKGSLKLGNEVKDEQNKFNESFSNAMKKQFSAYTPSSGELQKLVQSFEQANGEKAKAEYSIASLSPNVATINVKPEAIDFNKIDFNSIADDFVSKNKGKYTDYDKAQQDAEKYIMQQLPKKFSEASAEQPSYMTGDGYKIKVEKDGDSWKVDSDDSSSNYGYGDLKTVYMGGLSE